MLRQLITAATVAGLMAACASKPAIDPAVHFRPQQLFNDEAFAGFDAIPVDSQEEIFALDDDAKAFVKETLAEHDDPVDQMEALVHRIFNRSDFNLLYMSNANTTAQQTFENRAANCLSMSIMTYALAREAGFRVRFRDIQIPEYWTRREGYSVLNGHLNLVLIPKADPDMVRLFNNGIVVDFDPQTVRKHFPSVLVQKPTVVAMYYNNKGADALLEGRHTEAYAYFRASLMTDPWFDSPWVNLGFLYRLEGHYELAEGSYQRAITIDSENLTAWENLATLYEFTDRHTEAFAINQRVREKRLSNPYYHFILGEEAFENGDFPGALAHYERALELDTTKHEIYFGLAKTHFELGELRRSQYYLAMAKRKSRSDQDQERYQGKLDLFVSSAQ